MNNKSGMKDKKKQHMYQNNQCEKTKPTRIDSQGEKSTKMNPYKSKKKEEKLRNRKIENIK